MPPRGHLVEHDTEGEEIGAGVEWSLGATTLGSNLMFNILPSETAGENFIFSWQLIILRFGT